MRGIAPLGLGRLGRGTAPLGAALLSAVVVCGCATASRQDHEAVATITRQGKRITFDGTITHEAVQRFKALLTPAVSELDITSFGGVTLAGIALGELVHAANLDITVPRYCSSACAQYVFPAARHKRIEKGALLGWHGSVGATLAEVWPLAQTQLNMSPEIAAQAQAVVATLQSEADQEAAFYRQLSLSAAAAARLTQLSRNHGWRLWVGPPANGMSYDYQSASVAMTRTALEELGVGGIERYWYPSSREELEKALRENPLAEALAFPDYAVRPAFCAAFPPASGSLIDLCVDASTSRLPPRPTSAAAE
jgi:hypothetical protein